MRYGGLLFSRQSLWHYGVKVIVSGRGNPPESFVLLFQKLAHESGLPRPCKKRAGLAMTAATTALFPPALTLPISRVVTLSAM